MRAEKLAAFKRTQLPLAFNLHDTGNSRHYAGLQSTLQLQDLGISWHLSFRLILSKLEQYIPISGGCRPGRPAMAASGILLYFYIYFYREGRGG